MNLGSFSIYSVACLAAADRSMKKPLIFLVALLSQNDLLMPLSPLGLYMQMAMMFLWLGDYSISFYELSMSATTLKKQLWIFRNFQAQAYDLQTGTSQSFSRWFLQSSCTCFMSSSLMSLPKMKSQITDALPDRNPLTIYIFRSLSLLSLSLNSLLSSFLSFSLFFLSFSLERDLDRSVSLLTASDCSLVLRQEGMERQSQFSSLRQLFLLGIILILWMFHCAYSPFCYTSSQDCSDYAFGECRCVLESSSATAMSIITQEFFRSLPLLPDSCMKFTLGRSTQSSVVAPVGLRVCGRVMRSLEASISYRTSQSLGASGFYWTMSRLLVGPSTLVSLPRVCTFNILLRKPQLAECNCSAFIASSTIN